MLTLPLYVQVFGRDITDAHLSQGVLIVMSQGGVIRLYSFDHILSQARSLVHIQLFISFNSNSL